MKTIPTIILAVCVFLGVVGIFVFGLAGPKSTPGATTYPTVIVWGTLPKKTFDTALGQVKDDNQKLKAADQTPINISYIQKDQASLKNDLLQALVNGAAPDMLILPASDLLQEKNLLQTIPFSSYSERTFADTFIDEGELLKIHNGYFGLPFAVDPLVMYYNKTMLTQQNVVTPPQYWDEIISMIPKFTRADENSKIIQSTISLGEFQNIKNGKDILAAIFLQAGNPITAYTYDASLDSESLVNKLGGYDSSSGTQPSVAALSFYTQFADPTKSSTYTWNRSLANSQDYFLGGNLAYYIGYGSERAQLESKNPNLNFDMAFIPHERTNPVKSTYGNLYGIGILKQTTNLNGALQAIGTLSGNVFLKKFASVSSLPPVRRDLLSEAPTDKYSPVLYESALKAKGWLDPDSVSTDATFKNMIESVLNGRLLPSDAIQRADQELQVLTEKIK